MASGLILVDIQNEYFPGGRMELAGIEQAAAHARENTSPAGAWN
jgi:nicotinamidase-related amidase